MCLIALLFRVVEDAPLVVGANREEAYARGGEPPRLLKGPSRAVAGIDPTAGGTWLGVNDHGVVIAVTNRNKSEVPSQPRSRGLLVRELLGCTSSLAASEIAARELSQKPYAGCNIVCADGNAAVVVQAADWLRVKPLPPGIHVLTNGDIDDGSDRRVAYALNWLGEQQLHQVEPSVEALKNLCGQTGDGGTPAICMRGKTRGTVSSSILALRWPRSGSLYLHAQGPPDQTPYADYSHLLQQLEVAVPAEV